MGLCLPTCFRNGRSLRKRKARRVRAALRLASGSVVLRLAGSFTTNCLFAIFPESRATRAQFRIQKDKMLLRVEDADDKGREHSVVSIDPAPGNKRSAPRRDWTQC